MTNRYLELNHYNESEEERSAILKFSGRDFLNGQTYMWPFKFKINSNNFPLYIPSIINDFVPYNVETTDVVYNNPNDFYITDWTITLKYKTGNSKSTPILWEKNGFKQPIVTNMLQNKYFWINNSDEICQMINNAFARIVGSDMLFIVKKEDRWSLLVHSSLIPKIETIHFNDKMRRFFGFDYGELNGIQIVKLQTHNIIDEMYYIITTPMSNNKLFPFDKIIFKSEQLCVPKLSIQNYDNNSLNNSNSTILSFDLSISDISQVSTSMSFTSNEKDRSLSLIKDNLPDYFTITPFLVTKSGDEFMLQLKHDEKISFSIMFY